MTTLIFDIETDGIEATKIHMVCGLVAETGERRAWLSPEAAKVITVHPGTVVSEDLREFFKGATKFVGHNIIGYDCPTVARLHGLHFFDDTLFDTQVAFRLWKPDAKSDFFTLLKKKVITAEDCSKHSGLYSLKVCAKRVGSYKSQGPVDWASPTQLMFDYCCQDVTATAAVYAAIKAAKLSEVALRLEMLFACTMRRMEANGFPFNRRKAEELEARLRSELADAAFVCHRDLPPKTTEWWVRMPGKWNRGCFQVELGLSSKEEVIAKYGDTAEKWPPELRDSWWTKRTHSEPFNPGSRKQIHEYLTGLGWEPTEFTDGGDPKVDAETLDELAATGKYPLVDRIAHYLMIDKRLGAVADGENGWLKLVNDDGRMHGGVITIGTVTGRCAHVRPNMGQVPAVRKPFGKECRSLFGASRGRVLVGADASGLQLRCLAHYLAPIDNGEYVRIVTTGDVHSINQKAAGLPTRDNAKTFIYAWLFGAGDEKIGEIVGGGKAEGAALKARFLRGLPQLAVLKAAIERAVRERGFLFGLDGRPLPIRSSHAALNTLLMSAEAVLVKTATVAFETEMTAKFGRRSFGFCAHVHDEFQVEVDPRYALEAAQLAEDCIARSGEPYRFLCPLAGEAKIGKTWYDTH